uniref:protein-serine/threonine phosphatase n=1 Tax=Schistosoma mansoni TaxID=6183 RepID=A0A3Q0KMW0_SCHMA
MMCKGTAIDLNIHSRRNSGCIKSNDQMQDHLKRIVSILRFGDFIQLIIKLQSANPKPHQHRYCCVISTYGKLETEESFVLGVDITEGQATVGLVLEIWQDMSINLCGDGGFELITKHTVNQFKPVSVQALWAAFQAINKACQVARDKAYFCRGFTHDWVSYYHNLPASSTHQIQEWLKTDESDEFIQSLSCSPLSDSATDEDECKQEFGLGNLKERRIGKQRAEMEVLIRVKLQEIMYTVDLEEVTVFQLRELLEEGFKQPLHKFRHFIEKQILTICGQMDKASVIFDHVLLGTSFNASNRDELKRLNVTHILNVTREVDNFFPGDKFEYKNIRIYDDEQSTLLPYWEETHRFINEAKIMGTRCLVHCKMGISRSASTVIAYAMKENNWDLKTALSYVKARRPCVQPNPGFMRELHTYQGILEASSNRYKPIFHNNEVKSTKTVSPEYTSVDNQQNYCPPNVLINKSTGNEQDNNLSSSTMKVNMTSEKLEQNPYNSTVMNSSLIADGCLPTTLLSSSLSNFSSLKSSTSTVITTPLSSLSSPIVGQQSSSSSKCNDHFTNIIHQDCDCNCTLNLETELFAFKHSAIPDVTTKFTTNNNYLLNNNNNNNSKLDEQKQNSPSSLQQQRQEDNQLLMNGSSPLDNVVKSLSPSQMNRPVLWYFNDTNDDKAKSSGVVNSTIVAKDSHCLRQWHPDVFENVNGSDRHCILNNTNKLQKAISPSPSLRIAATSPCAITSVSNPQQHIHQLNYADTVSSMPWDYATELKMMPSTKHAKLCIIPYEPICIPLITCQLVLHASIIVSSLNIDKSITRKKHVDIEAITDDERTKYSDRKSTNVLYMSSKLSESNLLMTSVSQGKKEKILTSYESAFTPTLKWRKNQFICNNSNTTTTTTNILTTGNDVSNATFLSYPHQCDLMTQSTTKHQYMSPNDCINKSINDNSNDLKEISFIPLSNIKMALTERRKSSYPDLFMLNTNQNVTTNHAIVVLPERSHSTRSSRTSARLRPDNSWIMNYDSCIDNTVTSNSSNSISTTSNTTTTTNHYTITNSCSLFTSSSHLSSKANRTHDSPSVVVPQISDQSVISSKSVHSSLSSNNNENMKIGSVPSSDYYTKNHNYKPITTTTTYRPLRHLINNWPPPQPIDPIQVTESYCT